MKKLNIVMVATVFVALFSSCAPTQLVLKSASFEEKTAKELDPEQVQFRTMPMVVDLQVDENKIVFTKTYMNAYAKGRNIDNVRAMALYDAAKQYNADVIALPVYSITSDNDIDYTIEITGYPAHYKNFRNLTEEDKKLLGDYDTLIINEQK